MTLLLGQVTYKLATTGRLPFWAGTLIGTAILAACLLILRAELRRLRRRRGPRWLYLTRPLIILSFTWLLLQPVLYIRSETPERGRLLLLLDDSASMFLRDRYPDRSARLDLAQLLRLPGTEDRPDLCQRYAARLREQQEEIGPLVDRLRRHLDELEQGMPWGDSFTATLEDAGVKAGPWARFTEDHAASLAQLESSLSSQPAENLAATDPEISARFAAVREHAASCLRLRDILRRWRQNPDKTPQALVEIQAAYERLATLLAAALPALQSLQAGNDEKFLGQSEAGLPASLARVEESPRLALATQALERSGLLEALSRKHRAEVRLLQTAPLSEPGASAADLRPDQAARHTDLFTPIERLIEKYSLELLSGIVLLTDGQQNARPRPEVLQRIQKIHVPFLAVGVGSPLPAPDLALVDYRLPSLVLSGQKAAADVTVKTAMPAGTPYAVTLRAGDQEIGRSAGQADGTPAARHRISWEIGRPGPSILELAVEGAGPDANPGNNRLFLTVAALERRPKVLVIGQSARWDLVYLLRILEKGPFRTSLHLTNERDKEPGRGKGDEEIPADLADLKAYDLVILDDEPFRGFRDQDVDIFADYVVRAGGSLVLLQNFEERQKSSYRSLLSRRIGPLDQLPAPREAASETVLPGLQIAECSRSLHLVLLSAQCEKGRDHWGQISEPHILFPVPRQTFTLLESPGGSFPVFSLGFYGRGRIYQIGIGDLFRIREWHGAEAQSRFLTGMLEDAVTPLFPDAAGGRDGVALYPAPASVGQKTWMLLHLSQPQPASQHLTLELENGERRDLEARPGPPEESGLYVADWTPEQPGTLSVSAETPSGRIEVKTRTVLPLSRENIDFDLDEPGLSQMAREAGGRYLPLARLREGLEAIPERSRPLVNVREVNLWNAKALLFAIAALLTLDWVIRRKAGIIL
ncbi:MAG: hypothetical protein HYU36_18435 [Planctomycetes bacterium]|nr:hypothetical protein [Planctomycetota bacterium]